MVRTSDQCNFEFFDFMFYTEVNLTKITGRDGFGKEKQKNAINQSFIKIFEDLKLYEGKMKKSGREEIIE